MKDRLINARTDYIVCLVGTLSGWSKKGKTALGRGSARSGHKTILEQSRFSLDIYGATREH